MIQQNKKCAHIPCRCDVPHGQQYCSQACRDGAVKMFTQGLAREVGRRGITVNNVQPGPMDTDLNPAAGGR